MTDTCRPWAYLRPQGSADCPFLPPGKSKPIPVSLDVSLVGRSARSASCHLQFATICSEVSGVHFKLYKQGAAPDQFLECLDGAASDPAGYIIDDSTNGTYVDGKKLDKGKVYLVRNGCIISLAENTTKNGVSHYPVYMLELTNEPDNPEPEPAPNVHPLQAPDEEAEPAALCSPDPPEPPPADDAANTVEKNVQDGEPEVCREAAKPARASPARRTSLPSDTSGCTHHELPEAATEDLPMLAFATKLKSENEKLRRQLTATKQERDTKLQELERSHAELADVKEQHKTQMSAEKAKFQESNKEAQQAINKLRKDLRDAETQALFQEERAKAAEQSLAESGDALESLKETNAELKKQAQEQLKTAQDKAEERVASMRDEISSLKHKVDHLDGEVQKRDRQSEDLRQKLHEERSSGAATKQQVLQLKASLQKELEDGETARTKLMDVNKKMSEALKLNAELDLDRRKCEEEAALVRARLREAITARQLVEDQANGAREHSALVTAEYKSRHDNFEQVLRSMENLGRRFRASFDILFTESLDQDPSTEAACQAATSHQLVLAASSPVSSASRRLAHSSPTGDEPESKRARSSSHVREEADFPPSSTGCETEQQTAVEGNMPEAMPMDPVSIMDADTQELIPGRDYNNSSFDEETEECNEGGDAPMYAKSNPSNSVSPPVRIEQEKHKTVQDQGASQVATQDLEDFEEATTLLVSGYVPSATVGSPNKPAHHQAPADTPQNSSGNKSADASAPATSGKETAHCGQDVLETETGEFSECPPMTLGETEGPAIDSHSQPCMELAQEDDDNETCEEREDGIQDDRRGAERAMESGADTAGQGAGAATGWMEGAPLKPLPAWNITQADTETCQEEHAEHSPHGSQNLEKGATGPATLHPAPTDVLTDVNVQEKLEAVDGEPEDAPMHQDTSCGTPGEGDSLSSKEFSEGGNGLFPSLRPPEALQSWGARWVD